MYVNFLTLIVYDSHSDTYMSTIDRGDDLPQALDFREGRVPELKN